MRALRPSSRRNVVVPCINREKGSNATTDQDDTIKCIHCDDTGWQRGPGDNAYAVVPPDVPDVPCHYCEAGAARLPKNTPPPT